MYDFNIKNLYMYIDKLADTVNKRKNTFHSVMPQFVIIALICNTCPNL